MFSTAVCTQVIFKVRTVLQIKENIIHPNYFNFTTRYNMGVRGNVLVKALYYNPEDRGFVNRWSEWIFPIYLILPAALGMGVYSASNRNEY
jgi:hypothetical protein